MESLVYFGVFVLFLYLIGRRHTTAYSVKKSRSAQRSSAKKPALKTIITDPLSRVFITYHDSEGQVTKRNIEPIKTDSEGHIRAYCFMREELRTFLLGRIKEVVDVNTGECLDVTAWASALPYTDRRPITDNKKRAISSGSNKSKDIVTSVTVSLDTIEFDSNYTRKSESENTDYADTVYGLIPKKNSFDESFFVNPKTGNFKFPKYRHLKKYLVEIIDDTDYKSDIFDMLEPEERKDYCLDDFNEDVRDCCFDISVSELGDLVNSLPDKRLKELWRFSVTADEVLEYFEYPDDSFFTLTEAEARDIGADLVTRLLLAPSDQWACLTVAELKAVCKLSGISVTKKKKQDLIDDLISCDAKFPDTMQYRYRPTDNFLRELDPIISLYCSEIKKNLDRFHPVIIPHAWDELISFCDNTLVERAMRKVADTHYWLERMEAA